MATKHARIKRKAATFQLKMVKKSKTRRVKVESLTLPVNCEPTCELMSVSADFDDQQDSSNDFHDLDQADLNHDDYHEVHDQWNQANSSSYSTGARSYEDRQRQLNESWNLISPIIFDAMVESYAPPSAQQHCIVCDVTSPTVRCNHCQGGVLYCERCAIKLHSRVNFCHALDIWKEEDGRFIEFNFTPILKFPHVCASETDSYKKTFWCIDTSGQRNIEVTFCSCFNEIATLVKLSLFPATPSKPSLLVTYFLLDWMEAISLDCQVATKDFVSGMEIFHRNHQNVVKSLYPVILDCFEQYRFMKYRVQAKLLPELSTIECPACFQSANPITLSIDGNFGLCRKGAAGKSVQPPLHSSLYFLDQNCVDQFVNNYTGTISESDSCHNFLTSNALRSNTRFKALDETGVLGVVCRHEIPAMFLSLKHGERMSYIVYVLKKLKETYGGKSLNVFYDVACQLNRHLQKEGQLAVLDNVDLAVPIFHSYGHNLNCQLRFSPRNKTNFGLSDGEGCERLWSYLRRFSRITKEMRPSSRIDLLTDALLHYTSLAKDRLGSLLPKRLIRANSRKEDAYKNLSNIMSGSPEKFTEEDIVNWYSQEVMAEQQATMRSGLADYDVYCIDLDRHDEKWEEKYFSLLVSYEKLKEQMLSQSISIGTKDVLSRHISSIDVQLTTLELEKGISRIEVHSSSYQDLVYRNNQRKSISLKQDIYILARERWFLLKLKAKFADGQYLASRLSKSITKVTTKLRKKITEYNDIGILPLNWPSVTDLTSPLWYEGVLAVDTSIPLSVKLDSIQLYHFKLRAAEEVEIVKDDMKNTFAFYVNERRLILDAIQKNSSDSSLYGRGFLVLLNQRKFRLETILVELRSKFQPFVHLPALDFIPPENVHHNLQDSEGDQSNSCQMSIEENNEEDEESTREDENKDDTVENGTEEEDSDEENDDKVEEEEEEEEVEFRNSDRVLKSVMEQCMDNNGTLLSDNSEDDSSDSDTDLHAGFETRIPARKAIILEKEDFLQRRGPIPNSLSDEEQRLLSSIKERSSILSGGNVPRSMLKRDQSLLMKALAVSKRNAQLTRINEAGPFFKTKKK